MRTDASRAVRAVLAAIAALLLWGAPAAAAVEVYPVTALERGVAGVGYTVVEGTRIEPFDVEILGVMEGAGPAGSLVLVRASGEVIERAGGIASGMSGSPVYVDGKLLGAIGYGFELADHRIGLVTPAADMIRVMELIPVEEERESAGEAGEAVPGEGAAPSEGAGVQEEPAALSGLPEGIVLASSAAEAAHLAAAVPPGVWVARPVAVPLAVQGLGARAMERLREVFAGYDLIPVQAGGPPAGREIAPVVAPGAAIGVQLIRGDVELTAIGTLTAVDGRRFIAFGHPLFNRGEVDHFVTGAYIHHTVPSISFPFKIGAALAPIGSLLQDRGAAVAGLLDRRPETLALEVRVNDRDRRVEREFHAEIVRDRELTVPLAVVAALEAVDRALDRLGSGTARVRLRIEGEGMPRPLVRENVFYSGSDVAASALSELFVALDLLHGNEFQDPKLTGVSVDIEAGYERRTARIERARPSRRRVEQGETVDVIVTLRPFRAPVFDVAVPLHIPEDVGPGTVTVTVRGGVFGGYVSLPSELEGDLALAPVEGGEEGPVSIEAESLEKLIDEFEREPRNNEVVVEFYPPAFFSGRDEYSPDGGALPGEEEPDAWQEEIPGAGDDAGAGDGFAGEGDSGSDAEEDGGAEDGDDEQAGSGSGGRRRRRADDAGQGSRPVRAVQPTAYVIHGEAQFTLTIEAAPAEQEEPGEEAAPPPEPPAPRGPLRMLPTRAGR